MSAPTGIWEEASTPSVEAGGGQVATWSETSPSAS